MVNRITGKSLSREWGVRTSHALYSKDGTWHHHLKAFLGTLFDNSGYIVFHTAAEYGSNPHLSHGKHLHVTDGI